MSALTIVFGSPSPAAIRAGLAAVQADAAAQLVKSYRTGEQAALRTLDDRVLAQLPVLATGEALADLVNRVAALRASGAYQEVTIDSLAVAQVIEEGPHLYVMTEEVHSVATYPQMPGVAAIERRTAAWEVVYTLVQEGGRWKVTKVAAVER